MHILLGVLKWVGIVIGALLALLLVVLVILPPLTRSFTDRWGATKTELARPLPGDSLIAAPQQVSTRAITIKAPPELVFALLKQMGYQRGGWYGWDWFYNMTGSSEFVDGHHTNRIDPRLQTLSVGDKMWINKAVGYKVLSMDAPKSMVLYMKQDLAGHELPATQTSNVASGLSWAWVVQPASDGTVRLILRTRSTNVGQPGWVQWIFDKPLEMGGAVFGYKTLVGIKRTAESLAEKGVVVNDAGVQTAGPQ